MTKKVLIVGATLHGVNAVSSIMEGIVQAAPKNCEIFCFGFEENNGAVYEPGNYLIQNPYEGYSPLALYFRLQRKYLHLRKKDSALLASSYIFHRLEAVTRQQKFDLVIAVIGQFCYAEAAYLYASKHHIPLKIIYFDPFTDKTLSAIFPHRISVEKRWVSYADELYYNLENVFPSKETLNKKWIGFYIPIIPKDLTHWQLNRTLVYGGTFYPKIREPQLLYDFAVSIENRGVEVECYATLKTYPKQSSIRFFPLLTREAFSQKCREARALIYIGNTNFVSKSSKYLEYVAWRKPIVGINVEPDNDVRKYKYYFDAQDKDLIGKLNEVSPEELKNYNPANDFPERDPRQLAERLFA